MLKGFEDAFVDAQANVISLCLELLKNSEKSADVIYVYILQNDNEEYIDACYNVPLVKTQMKKIIVTAKTLYSHPKNVSKIYAALHTDLAW